MMRWLRPIAAITMAGALAGCGGGSKGATLRVGTSADFAPFLFKGSNGQLQGFETDMVKNVMHRINRSYKYQQQDFTGLVPALQSKHIDMVVSDLYATTARKQAIDFVLYAKSSLGFLEAKKNAGTMETLMDACGKSVGTLIGSPSEISAMDKQSTACTQAGKQPVMTVKYQSVSQELTDITNGRVYAIYEDIDSEAYAQHQTPNAFATGYVDPDYLDIGIGLRKGDPLEPALQKAVADYMASPAYNADAQKWGLPTLSLIKSGS